MQNQNNVEIVDPKTGVTVTPKAVIVEDSVTHQSGDGVTLKPFIANRVPANGMFINVIIKRLSRLVTTIDKLGRLIA